jgi:ketol-acid reductoisomerase
MRAYHDRDCDLGLIKARKVAVIGYGSQGRTQALNARDSGVGDIVVALKPGSKSEASARADGFEVRTVSEAVSWADVVVVLASDEAHRDLWAEEIEPSIRPGSALVFAHGLSIRFGLMTPGPNLDVILVSPKGIGPRIREIYQQGEGVYCLFGVHQDASGGAHALGLSYAAALGCGRKAILETTFRDECEGDLFGEQVVLCGGVSDLVHRAIETLTDAGYPPEVAWFECFYELKLVVDLMFEKGIAGAFGKISNTAEYGAYLTGPRIIAEPSRQAMKEVLAEVQDGSFVRKLMAEYDAGFPTVRAERAKLEAHPMEQVGRDLAALAEKARSA